MARRLTLAEALEAVGRPANPKNAPRITMAEALEGGPIAVQQGPIPEPTEDPDDILLSPEAPQRDRTTLASGAANLGIGAVEGAGDLAALAAGALIPGRTVAEGGEVRVPLIGGGLIDEFLGIGTENLPFPFSFRSSDQESPTSGPFMGRLDRMGEVSEAVRGATEDIVPPSDASGNRFLRLFGEELGAGGPTAAAALRRGAQAITRPSGRRFIEGRGTQGAFEVGSAAGAAGGRFGAQEFFPENAIVEMALGMGGGFAPHAGVGAIQGGFGGIQSARQLRTTPNIDNPTPASLDAASTILRQRAGIAEPLEDGTPVGMPERIAVQRLEEAQRLKAEEGIELDLGAALQTPGARSLSEDLSRTSPRLAEAMEDTSRRNMEGMQARFAEIGPPRDVDAREASQLGAQIQFDRAVDDLKQHAQLQDTDPALRSRMVRENLEQLWAAEQARLNGRWDDLRANARSLDAETIRLSGKKPRGTLEGKLTELQKEVDLIEHEIDLTTLTEGNPMQVIAAVNRRLLGKTRTAADDSPNALSSDYNLIFPEEIAEQLGSRTGDVATSMPVATMEGVLAFRQQLSRLLNQADKQGELIAHRQLTRIKHALDEDIARFADDTGVDFQLQMRSTLDDTEAVYQRFRDEATGGLLRPRGQLAGESATLDVFLQNPDRMREFSRKFPQHRGDMIDHVLAEAYRATGASTDGIPDPKALRRWKRNRKNAAILREFPEARAHLKDAETLGKKAEELGVFRPRSPEAINRGAVSIYISNPGKAFDAIEKSANPGRAMANLLDGMDFRAQQGVRDFYWQRIKSRIEEDVDFPLGSQSEALPGTNTVERVINPKAFSGWIRDANNRAIAVSLYGENHVKRMEQLSGHLAVADRLPKNFAQLSPKERKSIQQRLVGSGVFSVIQRGFLRAMRAKRLIDDIAADTTDFEARLILNEAMLNPSLATKLIMRKTRGDRKLILRRTAENLKTIVPRIALKLEQRLEEQEQRDLNPPERTAPQTQTQLP